MLKINKLLLSLTLAFFFILSFSTALSVDSINNEELHFFWTDGCPFCEQQKVFLEEINPKYPDLIIYDYLITEVDNIPILKRLVAEHPGSERYLGVVPLTFIDGHFFVGFNEDIASRIKRVISADKKSENRVEYINNNDILGTDYQDESEATLSIPIIGEINPDEWSLALLAMTIGTVDGFNVCSLGALVLILSLVLGLKSRKLTLILGGTFILITVTVYGLLVFMWHKVFLIFAPYLNFMEAIIGTAAFLGGLYFMSQFFKFIKRGAVCESQKNTIIQRATKRIQKSFEENRSILSILGGVILFAITVTIVEFPCTAVFPVIFTGILAEAGIPLSVAIGYILIYLLFYTLDEVAIFLIAVFTRKIWITSGKFMPVVSLIGAAILFFLSYYYFFVL